MAFLDLLPLEAYKSLENRAAGAKRILQPVKRLTRGWAPSPLAVIAHLTYRCNLDCSMCCQHIPEYSKELPAFPQPGLPREELTVGDWKRIIDDIVDSFRMRPFFHFGGGEPFLYTGLLELVEHAKSRGMNVSLITNGWFLESAAEKLVDLGINRINVSIDGPEDIHDVVRRKAGSFRRAIDGIRALRAVRDARKSKTPHVTINCTVTRENHLRLEEMVDVQQAARADALTFQHLVFLDHERELAEGIDVDTLLATLGRLDRERKDVTLYPHVPKEDWGAFYHGPSTRLGNGCGWNWVGLRLHPNGDVAPCRGLVMGRLTAGKSVREIWNSKEYKSMRSGLAAAGNYEDCGRCTHRQF